MSAREQAAGVLGPGKLRQLEEAGLRVVEVELGKHHPGCHAYWRHQAQLALDRARRTGREEDWKLADAAVQDWYLITQDPWAELSENLRRLRREIALALRIPQLVAWLDRRLASRGDGTQPMEPRE